MNGYKKIYILFMVLGLALLPKLGFSQSINWYIESAPGYSDRLAFDGAVFESENVLPYWTEQFRGKIIDYAYLSSAQYEAANPAELRFFAGIDLDTEVKISTSIHSQIGLPVSYVSIFPFRYNILNQRIEKLKTFKLETIEAHAHSDLQQNAKVGVLNTENSVLSSGDWFKLGLVESGVYLLNYNYLTSLDASFGGAPMSNIRIYGNGGDMLPELNTDSRVDDLYENPIQVVDQNNNGNLDPGDYVLFYGDATDRWEVKDGLFKRKLNFYSDTSYYFLTNDMGAGKRIQSRASAQGNAQNTFSIYDDHIQYQKDIYNFFKSGREWYGELFDLNLSQDFSFSIPNLVKNQPMCIEVQAVSRHTPFNSIARFQVSLNGNQVGDNMAIGGVSGGYGIRARAKNLNECITPNTLGITDNFTVNILYDKNGNSAAKGNLNYITIQAKRNLSWRNETMHFRNLASDQGTLNRYFLTSAPSNLIIWDVTDPLNPVRQNLSNNGGNAEFNYQGVTDEVKEFVAFSPSTVRSPLSVKRVGNQNIHADLARELIIVTHPRFLSEAERLAEYKRAERGLGVNLVTTEQIYNEFSSGKQDLTAIRDYLKMLFDRDSSAMKNVLLFGDCSYDFKYRTAANTNFVPVYESPATLDDIASQSSDDYIAFLSDGLGNWPYNIVGQRSHKMNLGVGRFPVQTVEQARVMVDKVIFYENKAELFGDWMNRITFVADDGDNNLHMSDADASARAAERAHPAMDIQKIYVDAFPEVSSPAGALSVEGKNALDRAIENGTLILNYSGHGGEVGWTEEQILRLDQISSWSNYEKLAFFFTATCEFGRYDDPEFISGGELVLLSDKGGAVSIMTTTRAVYASANKSLNLAFYDHVFTRDANGEQLTLGEIIKRTKNQSENINNRSFALLGDPSMKLNYPDKKVIVSEINDISPLVAEDTMKALCLINIKGEITDLDSSRLTDFNGFVDLKVFDKELKLNTLGNSGSRFSYAQYKNLLFKGKASVTDGAFSVNFVVPKDIDYSVGRGRITAYAYDEQNGNDANGIETRFFVGSSCDNVPVDNDPPKIVIYLDDTTFTSGSLTSPSPELIAYLEDENGINFTGTGIGHDITADVSAIKGERIILNDYYLSELDSYQKGRVNYQLRDLPDGEHTLTLKAWDTHNNSAEESVSFVVASDEQVALRNVMNYPNPFRDETYFAFDHNVAGDDLEIDIRILDRMGKEVKSGSVEILDSDTRVNGANYDVLRWDGSNSQNQKLATGIYFYEIKVRSKSSQAAEAQEIRRLVYIK